MPTRQRLQSELPFRDYFLAWAERVAPEVVARDQLIWHARIEAELDNVRAAIEWSAG